MTKWRSGLGDFFPPCWGRGGATPSVPLLPPPEPLSWAGISPICKSAPRHFPLACRSPTITALPQAKKGLERSASSSPSFGELVCSDRGPLGCWRWGRRDVGDMKQESQKPEPSPQTSRNQLPHPHPSPREPTGNRKCLLPGLARGETEKGRPRRIQPVQPLNLELARLLPADQRGWACCASFSKPASRGAEYKRLFLAFKTLPAPAHLSPHPLPSHSSTHSTSHYQYRGSDRQGLTLSQADCNLKDLGWVTASPRFLCFLILTMEIKIPVESPLYPLPNSQGHTFIQQACVECLLYATSWDWAVAKTEPCPYRAYSLVGRQTPSSCHCLATRS